MNLYMEGRVFRLSWLCCVLLLPLLAAGQQPGSGRCEITGRVVDDKSGEPQFGVVAYIADHNIWYLSADDGSFVLKNVPAGRVVVGFQRIGLKETFVTLELQPGEKRRIEVKIPALSLEVEEVVVTARENPNRMSTSSVIEKQAIEHIQASSLGDIMQLLPGQAAVNPDLNSKSQASLRTSTGNSDDEKISAMGTSIIMDGAPISNNANMQATNTAKVGAEGYFSTVSGGGVDLRQISADNIESVEVVRGIPSVKHGDLTSGAIIVNTKAGVTPFDVKVKVNPNTQQAYVGKGIKLKGGGGSVNVDFDYAHSQSDLRRASPNYDRLNLQLTHSTALFDNRLMMNNKLSGFRTYDNDRDKDGTSYEKRYSEDIGFRYNSNSRLQLHHPLSDCINLSVALDYRQQESYTRSLVSGAIQMLPHMVVDSTYTTQFLPSEYYSATYINGRPLNLFVSVDNRIHARHGKVNHRIMLGADWKTDANHGKGRYFDLSTQIFGADTVQLRPSSSNRPRPFSDIPAVNQLSVYLEDRVSVPLGRRVLKVQAGVRFDNIQPVSPLRGEFGQSLSPRVNVSYDLLSGVTLRGGYGLTSKAPALVYLYPDAAYLDAVSFQFYSAEARERLAILTTRVVNPSTAGMRQSEMTKAELGADFEYRRNFININVFREDLTGGYGFRDVLAAVEYPVYDIDTYIPGLGLPPEVFLSGSAVLRDVYKTPVNSKSTRRHGLEFTLNTAKIPLLGTQVNVSGAWTATEINDASNSIYTNSQYFNGNTNRYMAVYPTNGTRTEQFIATIRLIQHIPQFRFIASLAVQVDFVDKTQALIRGIYPVGYYDRDGNYVELSAQQSTSDEFAFLRRNFSETYYYSIDKPALWCINLKLTKEITNDISFSFYSNNMFMHHPAYRNRKNGTVDKRNPDLYFGAELNFKF